MESAPTEYRLFSQINEVLYAFASLARCPFLEGIAGEFLTRTAVVKILPCHAVVEVATTAPHALALGGNDAATATGLFKIEITGGAIQTAGG